MVLFLDYFFKYLVDILRLCPWELYCWLFILLFDFWVSELLNFDWCNEILEVPVLPNNSELIYFFGPNLILLEDFIGWSFIPVNDLDDIMWGGSMYLIGSLLGIWWIRIDRLEWSDYNDRNASLLIISCSFSLFLYLFGVFLRWIKLY